MFQFFSLLSRKFLILSCVPLVVGQSAHGQTAKAAGSEEQLYHNLLNVKERRLSEMEQELAKASKQINELEKRLDGQTVRSLGKSSAQDQEYSHKFEGKYEGQEAYVPAKAAPQTYAKTEAFESSEKSQAIDKPWSLDFESVYFAPRFADLTYGNVFNGTTVNNGVLTNKFDYEIGYKFGLGYQFSQAWEMAGHLTIFKADETAITNAPGIRAAPNYGLNATGGVNAQYTFARVNDELKFWQADLLGTKSTQQSENLKTNVSFGVSSLSLDFKRNFLYSGNGNNLTQNFSQSFHGLGPEIGVAAEYFLGRFLFIDAGLKTGALLGSHEATVTGVATGFGASSIPGIKQKDIAAIPYYKADIGLGWAYEASGNLGARVRLGYHFEDWLGLDRQFVAGNNTGNANSGINSRSERSILIDGIRLTLTAHW